MINSLNSQVVWNISACRPASGDELANLINKGWLLMNYASRRNDGKVWIDLTDKAEEEFEIRGAKDYTSLLSQWSMETPQVTTLGTTSLYYLGEFVKWLNYH